ncbi:MAG: flavin reductase family protein [Anaerolineae bacterium]|jgi:flavin reductase (DIM6/NTAB) family NADH-FMN oxidoreductase RutF|nr:flavin reductase family protein [Chloroflexota bacterium]
MTRHSLGPRALLMPTPVLLVGTWDANHRPNIMAAAWGGICCSRPPCVAVSLRAATYTHGSIERAGCYTISIPSADQISRADFAGLVSGRTVDKFAALGWSAVPAETVDAPCVAQCPLVLECRLLQAVELGSHTQFIGEVLEAHAEQAVLGPDGLPDIALVRPAVFDPAGGHYHGLGDDLGRAFTIGRVWDSQPRPR